MKAITVIWTGTVFLLLLAAVSLVRVKRDYGKYDLLRPFTVFLVWALYILHFCLFLFTVFNHEWPMDILNEVSLPLGGSLLLFGLWFFVAAVREFNSFKKMSGMETNKVITSGVYAYSRNPQNVGWVLFMLGIAFLGKSLGAILLVLIFTFIFHLHLPTEEKYLSRTLGKSYDEYRKKVPRYFGF